MKGESPAVVLRAGDAPVRTITLKCACLVVGVLIAGSAGAIDEATQWPPPMEERPGSDCIGGFPGVAGTEQTCTDAPDSPSQRRAEESSKRPLTLGSILDQGAKAMSPAEIRAAVSAGRLSQLPAPGFDRVTYKSDGTMVGHSYVANFLVYGEWRFDERGRQCFYWEGSGHGADHFGNYCLAWFEIGDSMFVLEVTEDADRGRPVTELRPR